ncbi:MAG: hypothetical protein ACYC6Y_28350, partial [Thermoguttaceae bacterium]
LGIQARSRPSVVALCFVLVSGDPFVYAGQSLKESMLQLSLMAAFVACVRLTERLQWTWGFVGAAGIIGIATTRPPYIILLILVLYWKALDKLRVTTVGKILIGLLVFWAFGEAILSFHIRENVLGDLVAGQSRDAESGLAMMIYRLPLVGPTVYYAMAPVPPMPWNLFSGHEVASVLIRGAGSIAWLLVACYVLRAIAWNWQLLEDRLFFAAAIVAGGVFMAVVLSGDDPRYKQPANYYLAIMLFLARRDISKHQWPLSPSRLQHGSRLQVPRIEPDESPADASSARHGTAKAHSLNQFEHRSTGVTSC